MDATMDAAVEIVDGSFAWDSPPPEVESSKKKGKKSSSPTGGTSTSENRGQPEKLFSLMDISISIPPNQLTAIVGMANIQRRGQSCRVLS